MTRVYEDTEIQSLLEEIKKAKGFRKKDLWRKFRKLDKNKTKTLNYVKQ